MMTAENVVESIVSENQEVLFRFYHCKFSRGEQPGRMLKDVYEVCAQAARSVRWTADPQRLLGYLLQRNRHGYLNGRPTLLRMVTHVLRLSSKGGFEN